MNVKDYKYIIEIAEQENVSKAADILCITQSALTKFLQRIEQELGVPLFFRKNNRLFLTEAGSYYTEIGKEILRLDTEVEKGIARIAADKEKQIRIGCSVGREDYVIQDVLAPFFEKHSDVCVRMLGGTSSSRLDMVENNELDMALVSSRDYRPGLTYYPVANATLVLAVSQHSPLIKKAVPKKNSLYPVVALEDWIEEPFIQLSAVTASGKIVREFFRKENVCPKIRLEVNSVSNCIAAVESGIGNAVFWEIPRKSRKVEYLTLKELRPEQQRMYVACRLNYDIPAIGKDLLRLLRHTSTENEQI